MHLALPARNRTWGLVDAMGLMGLIGFLVARFVPVASLIPFWGCGFRAVTGIPCPGCGLTRVAERLAHLNVIDALKINPLGTVAGVCFAAAIGASALHLFGRVPLPELVLTDREWSRVRWGVGVAFVLNYAWVLVAHLVLGYQ